MSDETAASRDWEHHSERTVIEHMPAMRCKDCGRSWLPDQNRPRGSCSGSEDTP